MPHREIETEVCIIGGGTGGYAAAMAVARAGCKCVVTEPTDWIGGQFTSQAVPPDENRWIERNVGVPAATGSYLQFRESIRDWYRQHRPLNKSARNDPQLNPGNGWVSHLCIEPKIAHAVMNDRIAPYIDAGRVTLLLEHEPVAADMAGDRVRSVTVQSKAGEKTTIRAGYFLDATELGDLLPLTKTAYRIGAESKKEFGELHGHPTGDMNDQQAISWCFAVENRPGENHTIAKPDRYDFFRNWIPRLNPAWPGKMLSWTVAGHDHSPPKTYAWKPWPQEPSNGEMEMWRYRRIVDRSIYQNESAHLYPDVALINMVQMDFLLSPVLDVSPEVRASALADAKQQSLSLLYWMQTEAPRFDGSDGVGFPGLKLRGNELGTADGFAKAPYIREARRLEAMFIVHEGCIGTEQRIAEKRPNQRASPYGMAEPFYDSVGIGHYRLDLHPSTGGRNTMYAQAAPFRIPLGAMIPKRTRNLIAAGKCLGVTHVANGAYRLHPIEWNIGEAAGELAALCLRDGHDPAFIRDTQPLLREFQAILKKYDVPLAWPWENGAGLS